MKIELAVGTVIGFVIGGAIGAAGGYLVAEKKFMVRLEQECVKMKESMKKEEKHTEESEEEETPAEDPVEEEKELNEYRDRSSIYGDPNQSKEENRVNYSGYSEPERTVNPDVDMAPVERSGNGPYRITYEQYNHTNPEYDKRIVTWFGGSHCLVDNDDESMLDVNETIGVENLMSIRNEGEVYIRNDALGVDYDVEFVDGIYEPM